MQLRSRGEDGWACNEIIDKAGAIVCVACELPQCITINSAIENQQGCILANSYESLSKSIGASLSSDCLAGSPGGKPSMRNMP